MPSQAGWRPAISDKTKGFHRLFGGLETQPDIVWSYLGLDELRTGYGLFRLVKQVKHAIHAIMAAARIHKTEIIAVRSTVKLSGRYSYVHGMYNRYCSLLYVSLDADSGTGGEAIQRPQ